MCHPLYEKISAELIRAKEVVFYNVPVKHVTQSPDTILLEIAEYIIFQCHGW